MGLAITVGPIVELLEADPEGAEWVREELSTVNDVLRSRNLPEHDEPETLPELGDRTPVVGFPYSHLHYLHRYYARCVARPDLIPPPVGPAEDPATDPVLTGLQGPSHHLLYHSDTEGYYVPILFANAIEDERLPGAVLGSSQRLLHELQSIARPLGVRLANGVLDDAEAARVASLATSDAPYSVELLVWIALFEAARLSVEHRTAIRFE